MFAVLNIGRVTRGFIRGDWVSPLLICGASQRPYLQEMCYQAVEKELSDEKVLEIFAQALLS